MGAITIKTRLTILFTALVAVILAIFSIATYSFTSHQRAEKFFSELLTDAIASAAVILRSDNLSPQTLQPFQTAMLGALPFDRITIFNKQGRSVFHSGEQILQLSEYELQQALKRGRYVVTSRDTGFDVLSDYQRQQANRNGKISSMSGDTQRVIIPFLDEDGNLTGNNPARSYNENKPFSGNEEYLVAVASVDKKGLKSLYELRKWLLGGYLASLLIVFVMGRYFASRAMAPISDIRKKAEKISVTDLHIRLSEGKRKDELHQLSHAFNEMLDRIEAAFTSQKQFVAHASHELRTPLTTLAGQLDVSLMHTRSEDDYKGVIASALDSTRNLNRLLSNLLLLAKTESESLKPLRLDEIVFSALKEIKRRHISRKIDVNFNMSSDGEKFLNVMGNEDLLKIAVANVLENALKFSGEKSVVSLIIEIDNEQSIVLKIEDNGIGISSDELPKVFQPFYRAHPFSEVAGSGIGLALVKAVMDRHGGAVDIKSRPGTGTMVLLKFPILSAV